MVLHEKYDRGSIYLSGGMEFADNLGAGWRETCSGILKNMGYFPIDIADLDIKYQEAHGDIMGDIRFDTTKSENQRKASVRLHFIDADLQLITNDSDAMIVLYDESARLGAGTISECQHAYDNGVPIFVMSAYKDWKKEVPSWLHALSTRIFTDWAEMYCYLDNLPRGILIRDQYGNHRAGNEYLCSLTGTVFYKAPPHFVSYIDPLYCKEAVEVVAHTHEQMYNRYNFFMEQMCRDSHNDV